MSTALIDPRDVVDIVGADIDILRGDESLGQLADAANRHHASTNRAARVTLEYAMACGEALAAAKSRLVEQAGGKQQCGWQEWFIDLLRRWKAFGDLAWR